jgi:hypothetical protein
MYCGGNQLISEGGLRGSGVVGVVLDPAGEPIGRARVQVQASGKDDVLKEFTTDARGRFRVQGLRNGAYLLGVSAPGFNLHYWHLVVARTSRWVELRVDLSVGT